MVLGLRTKSKKGTSIHVNYTVQVQDIKPWPPSQSLKSLRSVLLQWENGERSSGSTNAVVPSLGEGKIEFNESFKLPVILFREASVKGGDSDTFQKNCLEFNLYEPRRDKTVKGQLLGTVIVDLAEYGVLKEPVIISAPMNCKRSFRNTAQPLLYVKLQPYDKRSSSSSSRESLSKEASLDKDGRESISALMNGEYADEAEIASFTDDDMSSHSSLTVSSSGIEANGGSPPQNEENTSTDEKNLVLDPVPAEREEKPVTAEHKHLNGSSSRSSSVDFSSGAGSPENDQASLSNSQRISTPITEQSVTRSFDSSPTLVYEGTNEESKSNNSRKSFDLNDSMQGVHEKITNGNIGTTENVQQMLDENNKDHLEAETVDSESQLDDNEKALRPNRIGLKDAVNGDNADTNHTQEKEAEYQGENVQKKQTEKDKDHSMVVEHNNKVSPDTSRKPGLYGGDTTASRRGLALTSNSLRQVKSVRSSTDLTRINGLANNDQDIGELKGIDSLEDSHTGNRSFIQNERKNSTSISRETRTRFSDSKVQQLEDRIEKLERELREAALLEVSLYSIVAEHGSSANKVHAPARRLSRLYMYAWKQWSQARRASAARSAISGLVLVAKACGNDVPRLTFWLSNCVVLRAIISPASENSQLPVSSSSYVESNGGGRRNGKKSLPLKWKDSSPSKKENNLDFSKDLHDWEEPNMFTAALEKIEAWIFSRIIESVWWQTLTPHMQSASRESEPKINSSVGNSYGRKASFGDQEQVNYSLDLWKKAFKDARERLCPVRAAGYECGCLPMLARLVMEQCVSRLDVAMFNAILRESAEEAPTDPISDPISDSKVLPIPSGKSSFGAGAQLKNAIGNWSRWLTDLFGIDDDDCPENAHETGDDDRQEYETSSKSFYLLNALSDLTMLPKDMLLDKSIRKEVCPAFGAPLIKTILNNFSPDEFCPDPIPEEVFDALDAEDSLADDEESIRNYPCNAAPVVYSPPSAALLASFVGEVGKESRLRRSGSSVIRKSYTSDDELDELDSPLTSITNNGFSAASTPKWKPNNKGQSVVRYQLLQEVWREGN